MSEQTKPPKFSNVDGGLGAQLKANVLDADRPMLERVMSAATLLVARGLLEQINADGMALPGAAPAPEPLPPALPSPYKPEGSS